MATPDVGIGIVGYGMMGRAHAYAYTSAPVMRPLPCQPQLRVISGRDQDKVSRAATAFGFDDYVTDWRDLVNRPDVDIVDICTPPARMQRSPKPPRPQARRSSAKNHLRFPTGKQLTQRRRCSEPAC